MKKLHLICNAHLDPIWQWSWDEGISAALATFKSAADLADEFDYIFCHNESLLYEAVEKNAPELFERIKRLVKAGKWVITGGWYLQPDALMPSGESIVRQICEGHRYFEEKFGVTPTVATNFDSFGHSIGLVQIMKKCGYNGYLICRPRKDDQITYPSRFFKWTSPDGSSIIVSNSASYSSALGMVTEKIKKELSGQGSGMLGSQTRGNKGANESLDVDYVLWGVGNHGGGPSRKDLRDIEELKIDGVEIIHSTPERLFADNIKVGGEMTTSLVTVMPGCYSTMAKIKGAHRETENLYFATEKMLSVATLAGYGADTSDMTVAEKRLMLAQFHDILPGTSVPDGESEGIELLATARKILKDFRTGAFLYLVMGEKAAADGEFPIFVFNYMPYEVKTPVEVEFSLADQNWSEEYHFTPTVYLDGEELPSQVIKEESTLNLDWRKKIVFDATLAPLSVTRFSAYVHKTPIKENKLPDLTVEHLIESTHSPLTAPVTLESYEDTADPWGMSDAELLAMGKNPEPFRLMTTAEVAEFCAVREGLQPIHTVEDGDIYTAVEGCYTCRNTNAAIEYKFYKNKPYTDIKLTLEFADKNRLVRLKIPAPRGIPVGDGPYVVEEKPTSAEASFQKWYGIREACGEIFSVINKSTYAGKTEDGYIYLTLLRGAGYCFHPIGERELYPQNRYLPRIDSGRYVFNFRIFRGSVAEVTAEAELFNQPPYAVNVFPTGEGKREASVSSSSRDIVLSVIKPARDGDGYILRLYNPTAEEKKTTLRVMDKSAEITLSKHEVKTVRYSNGNFTVSAKMCI
ncbi:MAG: hypothetical protein IJ515_04505 [Clostridia bacterium]|nr:hypothetical protein [Clostridia bacterium]